MDPRMTIEAMQDEEAVKAASERQSEMENERAPWENLYRQVEAVTDPLSQGGFSKMTPGGRRGAFIYDPSAIEGLERYEAARVGMSVPRGHRWHGLVTTNADLNKLPEVARWCEYATDRLFAMRYNPDSGFETQIHEDARSGGLYGTESLWVDEQLGHGFFYKALHASEVWIDEDYRGRVDTVHRKWECTVRQIEQQFPNGLSPKMREALDRGKPNERFCIVQAIRPNASYMPGKWDWTGKPIESLTFAPDEKWILRRSGYHTMPLLVSRVSTSPRDKYGRSPAMRVLSTSQGLQEIAKTILKGAHKAVDPPILFHDDGQISKFSTRPGGMNPGMIDDMGRVLARPLESGGQLPVGLEVQQAERKIIDTAFLGEFFWLLTQGRDRMTATEVLEVAQKQGVLVAPLAARHECEKLGPLIARELDMGLRSGQILPPPPVMREAGASLRVIYDNPISRMARMEEVTAFSRWSEMLLQIAAVDQSVIDLIDTESAARGVAEILGVRPSWIATPDQVAAKRQAREEAQQTQDLMSGAAPASQAVLNLAKAGQIGQAA